MLQRIRYRDGVIGVATRNHYTEMDWNVANRWLVTDISADLAGPPDREIRDDGRPRALPATRHHTEQAPGRVEPPDLRGSRTRWRPSPASCRKAIS
jgi:hypothetical protein